MTRKSEGRLKAEAQVARLEAAGWYKAEAGRWRHPDRPLQLKTTDRALYIQDLVDGRGPAMSDPDASSLPCGIGGGTPGLDPWVDDVPESKPVDGAVS